MKLHTDIAAEILKTAKDPKFLELLDCEQSFAIGSDADKSNEYIEDCINRKEPLMKVLRLCCLHSVSCNGLKPKLLEFYRFVWRCVLPFLRINLFIWGRRREILQTYGFEHVLTLDNLERAGLLKSHDSKGSYAAARKAFNLVVEESQVTKDIAYTYSGYAPLSVRLVQALGRIGGVTDDALRTVPGPQFELRQELPQGLKVKAPGSGSEDQLRRPVTLVFFLGGCTFAEISALRFLSEHEGG